MKFDTLWWKAFWAWFAGMTMFYGCIVTPIAVLEFWNRGPVFELWALAAGIPILVVLAAGLSAWAAVEGYCTPSKNHRGWALRISARMGRRLMWYFNPFWIAYALLFSLGGIISLAIQNLRCPDDTEAE